MRGVGGVRKCVGVQEKLRGDVEKCGDGCKEMC